jgi:alpha-beta hydrolase superfamily lysophospholipase
MRSTSEKWLMVLIGGGAVLAGAAAAAYLGIGYLIYRRMANVRGDCDEHMGNSPDHFVDIGGENWPPFDFSPYYMPRYETVRFPSRQAGLKISGWYVEGDPGAPAVILVHGRYGCKRAQDILLPAGMLARNGFHVLMIDLRDVGDSDPDDGHSSLGNDEYLDVLGAFDWLVQRKGFALGQFGLFANSMGGAAALYAFGAEPHLAALFLQSTFGNLRQIMREELRRAGLPVLLAPAGLIMGRIAGGIDLLARDPISAMRGARGRPVYIVHSRNDRRIDVNQSEQLAAAARAAGVKVTAWFPERGYHVQTPAWYPEEFEQRMVGFFRDSLGG